MSFNCYTPREAIELISRAGVYKANMRLDKTIMSSFNAGFILALACATTLSTLSSKWYQENAAGLIKTIAALVFPYGLTIIILTGSELCTGSFMFTTVAALHRRITVGKMLRHWFLTFWGNLAGSLFSMAIMIGYGGGFDSGYYKIEAQNFAIAKQVTPRWHQIFIRGIGANMMVCLACFLGMCGRDYISKVIGIWWPAFAFVSLSFDHVVANMFFIPIGIWHGAAGITVKLYIWKGILPALLGNIIGGGLFVGIFYWYLYITGNPETSIDGNFYEYLPNHDTGRVLHLAKPDDIESGQSDKTPGVTEMPYRK